MTDSMDPPSYVARARAFAVHILTASGGALALLVFARGDGMPVAIIRGSYAAFAGLCWIAFTLRREREVALEP